MKHEKLHNTDLFSVIIAGAGHKETWNLWKEITVEKFVLKLNESC